MSTLEVIWRDGASNINALQDMAEENRKISNTVIQGHQWQIHRCQWLFWNLNSATSDTVMMYSGPCILRPPIQTEKYDLKLKVFLKWSDIYNSKLKVTHTMHINGTDITAPTHNTAPKSLWKSVHINWKSVHINWKSVHINTYSVILATLNTQKNTSIPKKKTCDESNILAV